ncbi:hypothetical protein FB45DRAFT_1053774 [Roridomyces roridus]|uniref:F-box domain-containing protein n=1 Tax=Roridomyces roridus TaxID=1738132 RepID=A0AAD7FSN1_9AGAR|nr:hypothetical protein FB45DRAFT_1053774 [Roridomyces roridus]
MNDHSEVARAADRARIGAIDAEISELEQRLCVLQMERESCQQQLDAIRALQLERETFQQRLDAYKYPVLTLPNEITSEIFVVFLPPYPDCPPLRGLYSPTTLTHICSRWREIALATERWQHVRLELQAEEVALIEGPMPLLESLYLAVDEWDYIHPAASASGFPRLRSVSLDDADHGNWLPLSQLTTLALQEVYEMDYLPLLRDAVNLVHLHLIYCIPPKSGHTFTRLETLVVVDDALGGLQTPLHMFTLPVLRGLQWSLTGGALGRDHINSVTSLISRSGCKLQQVLFTGKTEVSEQSLRAAFPSVPKVTLDIEYDWYSEESRGFENGLEI